MKLEFTEAAALSLNLYGGGVGSNTPDVAPTISSTPSPEFTEGTAGTYDMTQHVTDDGLSPVTYSLSVALPSGLTFDSATGILTYDGLGADIYSEHQLTATDGAGSAQSDIFGLQITAVTGDTDLTGLGTFVDSAAAGGGDGTVGSPFNTLPTGLGVSGNVYIKAGSDFDLNDGQPWGIDWSGISGNRALITAYYMDGGTPKYIYEGAGAFQQTLPKIHGISVDGSGLKRYQIRVENQDYVAIEYVDLSGDVPGASSDVRSYVLFDDCNYCILRQSKISNGSGWEGVVITGGSNNKIQYNQSLEHGSYNVGGGQPDYGDTLGILAGSTQNLVEWNDFRKAGHTLVNVESSNNLIRYNTLDQDRAGGLGNHVLELRVLNGQVGRNVVEYNVIKGAYISADDANPQLMKVYGNQNIVRFNTVAGGNGRAFQTQISGTQFAAASENAIYNNDVISYGLGSSTASAEAWRISDVGLTGYTAYGGLFFNNYIGDNNGGVNYFRTALVNNLESGADAWNFFEVKGNAFADSAVTVQSSAGSYSLATAEASFSSTFASNALSANKASSGGVALALTTNAGTGVTIGVDNPFCFSDGNGVPALQGDSININGTVRTVASINYAASTITVDSSLTWTSGVPVNMDVMLSGTDVARGVPAGITPGAGANASRIEAILLRDSRTVPLAYNMPADPVTTSVINVPADMSFASAVQVSGAQIIVAAGYSGAGYRGAWGSDLDIVMDNTAIITSRCTAEGAERVRWTGGNVIAGQDGSGVESNLLAFVQPRDWLIDNVVFRGADHQSLIRLDIVYNTLPGNAGHVERMAFINTTLDLQSAVGDQTRWPIVALYPYDGTEHEDVILANVRSNCDGPGGQVTRLMSVNRLVAVDSYMRNNGEGDRSGFRMHESVRDPYFHSIITVGLNNWANTGGQTDPNNVIDADITNWHVYNGVAAYGAFSYSGVGVTNSGLLRDSTVHSSNASISPPFSGMTSYGDMTNDGGNQTVVWDGTLGSIDFDIGIPGKTLLSHYGADH